MKKAINYYRYKSSVGDVTKYTYFNTVGTEDSFFFLSTAKLKKEYREFKKWLKQIKKDNPQQHFDTNKIVFELEDGTFVGWYDGGLNYGNSVKHDNYITPIKLK